VCVCVVLCSLCSVRIVRLGLKRFELRVVEMLIFVCLVNHLEADTFLTIIFHALFFMVMVILS